VYAHKTGEIIIHDGNKHLWDAPKVEGETKKKGLIPRNYEKHPVGSLKGIVSAVQMPTIPRDQWAGIVAHKAQARTRLSDQRNRGNKGKTIPSRDQNGRGYCWNHSPVSAHLLHRAKLGLPYVDLSAYAGACIIKNFRDQGGWGAHGLEWMVEHGCPTSKTWPQQGTSRNLVNDAMWKEAARYKVTGVIADLQAAVYDRNLSWDQQVTCLLNNWPTIIDLNWWGHSIAGADVENGVNLFDQGVRGDSGKLATAQEWDVVWEYNTDFGEYGGFGVRIWNSWGDKWSQNGMGILTPQKSVADGCTAIIDATPSEEESVVAMLEGKETPNLAV
jgi:hypothetical protein